MKKLLISASSAIGSSVFLLQSAFAQNLQAPNVPGLENTSTGESSTIITIILRVIAYILNLVLVIGVIFVIIAGLRLIVSGGDEGEKDKAKQTIIYVIVGIIVVVFARVIVFFADKFFR